MEWYNEPPGWNAEGDTISLTTGPQSDFWRKTHYGFVRDNGHFYYQTVTGDFTLDVKVSGQYNTLYDQAGLMVRQDETTWVKCGIEYVDGVQYVSAVVTRDYSDWSVLPLMGQPEAIWLRLKRIGGAIEIFYSLDGAAYAMYRTTHLSEAEALQVGVMACTPERDGLTVTFEGFSVSTA